MIKEKKRKKKKRKKRKENRKYEKKRKKKTEQRRKLYKSLVYQLKDSIFMVIETNSPNNSP